MNLGPHGYPCIPTYSSFSTIGRLYEEARTFSRHRQTANDEMKRLFLRVRVGNECVQYINSFCWLLYTKMSVMKHQAPAYAKYQNLITSTSSSPDSLRLFSTALN